jgi:hypothetical protein
MEFDVTLITDKVQLPVGLLCMLIDGGGLREWAAPWMQKPDAATSAHLHDKDKERQEPVPLLVK